MIEEIKSLLGSDNIAYIDEASHSVFVDQQQRFIDAMIQFTSK